MGWRLLIVTVYCGFGVAGCGDSHRPVVRQQQSSPAAEAPTPAAQADPHGFHGQAHPTGTEGDRPVEGHGGTVKLGSMQLAAPETWIRKRPAISFILGEFSIPRAEGDDPDGRLTVSVVGGSLEENVSRWRAQFGEKPRETRTELEAGGVKMTVVDFSGTFQEQRGPMAPVQDRPGYRMLGAVIPVGEQLYFVKCYGPEKTIGAHADEFHAFLKSLGHGGSP